MKWLQLLANKNSFWKQKVYQNFESIDCQLTKTISITRKMLPAIDQLLTSTTESKCLTPIMKSQAFFNVVCGSQSGSVTRKLTPLNFFLHCLGNGVCMERIAFVACDLQMF